jgi:hypothetical protein
MTEKVKHGANGEFLVATWLLEELGLAAGPYDIQMVAQVIAYAARDSKTDAEAASRALLASAQAAVSAGENVNVFWFKDRKFAQGKKPLRDGGSPEGFEAARRANEEADRRGYEMWQGMSEAYRKANPWGGGNGTTT